MRAGEIEALRLRRLNLLKGTADVVEAVGEVEGVGLVFGPTKTYQRRTVRLPRFLCDMLGAHLAGRAARPEAFVFAAREGGPIRHHNFYRRHFKPAVRRLAARGAQEGHDPFPEGLRFHDLRVRHEAPCIRAG
jgi:integrase